MSLYAEYIKERLDLEIIELEHGYATYKFIPEGCYIEDIYVRPDFRRTHLATELADQIASIAKARGCTKLFGTVAPNTRGATSSLKTLLGYGMTLLNSSPQLIVFSKDI